MPKLKISDVTLRDGNHAISHQLNEKQIESYLLKIDNAGLSYIEVGHGNGLGASSFQVGKGCLTDRDLLTTARRTLKKTKLGIHAIPGFATINKDLKPAIDCGVEVFRIASHCTEADTTEKQIQFLKEKKLEVFGVLMMSHMASTEALLQSALLMESFGADGIILMDSAGAYLPDQVLGRIQHLKKGLKVPLGFHAHNNLGLAVANTLAAIQGGATILDATARGFGAGAGNCQLEVLVAVLQKLGYETGVDLYTVLDSADLAEKLFIETLPFSKTMSITTALAGIFSGFAKHLQRIAEEYHIDPKDLVFALGNYRVVAGQEDMIVEVAKKLSKATHASS